eukprot:9820837-Ditylum_brightwellii.AAC.1
MISCCQKGEEEVLYNRPLSTKIVDGDLDVDYNNDGEEDKDMEMNASANIGKKKETELTKSI